MFFLLKERAGKLLEVLRDLICSDIRPVAQYEYIHVENADESPEGRDILPDADASDWQTITNAEVWGGHRERFYFRTTVVIPPEFAGKRVIYELRTGREGEWDAVNPQFMAYVNGIPRQGLDVNHRTILLAECAEAEERFEILLSAFTGDQNFHLLLDSEIKTEEPEIRKYYYDIRLPYETARLLPPDSTEYILIIQAITDSLNRLDLREKYSPAFFESLKEAQRCITEDFYEKICAPSPEVVACVGHTHIDCAWLWTLRTTRDKAVRSFSTVLELMKRYPEYKFMSSQPQLYDYVKQDAPEIYEQIRARVAEGRWEAEGGMWVEADCNITSGESFVRQLIHGLGFFQKEFGKKNRILWLPDVFGYSAALPQIMKKCGLDYFMTTKISWNEFNRMPCDTFIWRGIDGSEVLTHFSSSRDYNAPAVEGSFLTEHYTTYNALLDPSQVKGNWKRYGQKELQTESLMIYGYGDGGGGPTEEMLENCRRMEKGIPGCPQTHQTHAREFFEKLEKDVAGNRFLPTWEGELYLEYHRGTYTSMARNKRYNRKAEFALQNLEWYAVMAGQMLNKPYPGEKLHQLWEIILRNQFHDILPGSSIHEVYEDSRKEYERLFLEEERIRKELAGALADAAEGDAGDIAVFNPNSADIPSALRLCREDAAGADALLLDGQAFELQETAEGDYVAVVAGIPAKGYSVLKRLKDAGPGVKKADGEPRMIRSCREIETPFFHVILNEKGQFISLYDRINEREVIPRGEAANRIVSYEDIPHNYDAWDINHYYTEKSWEIDEVSEIEITENGPVRACLKITRNYLSSVIVQHLYFYRDLPQIDIRNEIDWNESHILLRDYFPVDIHTDEAVFEIQYGNVKRPTHSNTSWDQAKFEVLCHKWLDVSEEGYGVSILNESKFGCSVKNGVIGLTMLKSATYPNPDADREHHSFTYAICPHDGDFRQGRTIAKAYMLNNPLLAVKKRTPGGILPGRFSAARTEEDHVTIEVIKKAIDGDGTILRLYETDNRRGKVTLHVCGPYVKAWETDLLEEKKKELTIHEGMIEIYIMPYEIRTICLEGPADT